MSRIVFSSLRKDSGKTSLIVGLCKASGKNFGYMKPLGDRLMYRKKRLWDYDAALMVGIFGLSEDAGEITIGFEPSRLGYMYDRESIEQRIRSMAEDMEASRDVLAVEAGRDIRFGSKIHMDAISLAKCLDAKMVMIIHGDENTILDDISFLKRYIDLTGVKFGGVIINQIPNLDDFTETRMPEIKEMGVPVLGCVPYVENMNLINIRFLAEKLMAKVIAGEKNINGNVKNVLVGAMNAEEAIKKLIFNKADKLIITSGDRTDMLLATLEHDTAAVLLTNNLMPPQRIISRFDEAGVPLLLTHQDTYQAATQVNELESLLTINDDSKIDLLEKLSKKHLDIETILDSLS